MIKNYSTEVPPERTVAEITGLLIEKGARSITSVYDKGVLSGVHFEMEVGGVPVPFSLPINADGVANAILKTKPYNNNYRCTQAEYKVRVGKQAKWVAWRILKDWIAAQMALIESEQVELAQVFMPYALNRATNQTMYTAWVENNQRMLGAGT